MRPSAIIKLVIVFSIVILSGTALIFFLNDKQVNRTLMLAQIKPEIVKESVGEPTGNPLVEEYHLSLRILFYSNRGEKIIPSGGELNITVFKPILSLDKPKDGLIMKPVLNRLINLSGNKIANSEMLIPIKSGFKLTSQTDCLSVSVEYIPQGTTSKTTVLRADIPYYQY